MSEEVFVMTSQAFDARIGALLGVLVLVSARSAPLLAQHDHTTVVTAKNQSSELVRIVREATERFKDPAVADNEGYQLAFGCVSGPDAGAMGLHFVNMDLVGDPALDPRRPEIVLYEPLPNGRVRLTGADFLVLASAWDALHPGEPPQIMGQLLHLFEAPNRFGLPAFYTLHVWAWKENPTGTFVNWHAKVSCDSFGGQ
jgi:hypothetical protein